MAEIFTADSLQQHRHGLVLSDFASGKTINAQRKDNVGSRLNVTRTAQHDESAAYHHILKSNALKALRHLQWCRIVWATKAARCRRMKTDKKNGTAEKKRKFNFPAELQKFQAERGAGNCNT